jgi:hypothetical protein
MSSSERSCTSSQRLGILAEEMLARVGAAVELVVLVLAVADFVHALLQPPRLVAREQRVPQPAPDHLDHVPARAAEDALELLDDLAVAAHRSVEALQVAVDDEDQVVQLLATGEPDGSQRLGLVAFAVAQEGPHLAVAVVDQAAILLVAHHVRLVDRLDRAEAHRHRRELPVIGHQPRVRVGRQPAPVDFAAEIVELLLAEPPLEIRASIHPGRAVPLEEHQVTRLAGAVAAEEIIETHVVERGAREERRDVAAEALVIVVGAHHHRERVPADQRADAPVDEEVAGHALLRLGRNGVAITRGDCRRQAHAGTGGVVGEPFQQVSRAGLAAIAHHGFQRFQPFAGFRGIDILLHEYSCAWAGRTAYCPGGFGLAPV